ncbi:MAG: glutathione peroxidase [Deltaproteobacteria bacterium]|nr:glutathione peroxidase [Deltaproteobacteria bacterium]
MVGRGSIRRVLVTALALATGPAGCGDDDASPDGGDDGGGEGTVDVPDVEPDETAADDGVAEDDAAADAPDDTAVSICDAPPAGSIFELSAVAADGEEIPLSRYCGQVMLLVNVAALCGYTPQFDGLQDLYGVYGDDGLVVLGFYCDQFLHQAGSPAERAAAEELYGVTFPIFDVLNVNPPGEHPIFTWLKSQPGGAGDLEWNFEKFLVGRDGTFLERWPTATTPMSGPITTAVEAALAAPAP